MNLRLLYHLRLFFGNRSFNNYNTSKLHTRPADSARKTQNFDVKCYYLGVNMMTIKYINNDKSRYLENTENCRLSVCILTHIM